jgi:GNAT superfamily N-acetyltransferase
MCALWREYMDFHRERDPHFTMTGDGHRRFGRFVSRHMTARNSRVMVAEQDGKIVAYCMAVLTKYPPVFKRRDCGAVFDLAVTRRCRRTGIGEKLYRAVEEWFARRGVHRIEVRVAITNETSTSFWRKMGFTPFVTTVFKRI